MPGKSASRPLLPIDDTIKRRLSLNIEFKFWIKEFGINAPMIHNCFKFRKGMIYEQIQERTLRPRILGLKEPRERIKIKKYVGEFY